MTDDIEVVDIGDEPEFLSKKDVEKVEKKSKGVYCDNKRNRSLGLVGLPYGSKPTIEPKKKEVSSATLDNLKRAREAKQKKKAERLQEIEEESPPKHKKGKAKKKVVIETPSESEESEEEPSPPPKKKREKREKKSSKKIKEDDRVEALEKKLAELMSTQGGKKEPKESTLDKMVRKEIKPLVLF